MFTDQNNYMDSESSKVSEDDTITHYNSHQIKKETKPEKEKQIDELPIKISLADYEVLKRAKMQDF